MTGYRRDDEEGPGEETGPPWERAPWNQPGWDEVTPAQRRLRDDNAHPSGPLPQVSSGPLPRLPSEAWPSAVSGPLPPEEAWPPGEPGYTGARREDTSYLRTGLPEPGYAGAGARHRGDQGADHAEQGRPGTGAAGGEYPSRGGGTGGS